MNHLISRLNQIVSAERPPHSATLTTDLQRAIDALRQVTSEQRPRDERGNPGGLVSLRGDVPTVAVPDLHARQRLILSVLRMSAPSHGINGPLVHALANGSAQLVFVGDYVHAEARARQRWYQAYAEYEDGFSETAAMDEEMRESLGTVQMIAALLAAFPGRVHTLKGNHENISNESREGNMPFGKFVYEGAMVEAYMQRFYAGEPFEALYHWEKSLPLLAVGSHFIIGHAEPARFISREEVIRKSRDDDVVRSLTWTANDEAEQGSVARMLAHYLPADAVEGAVYLGGHRPVSGLFTTRASGAYVQFHNPDRYLAAIASPGRRFDPTIDIVELADTPGVLHG